MLKAGEQMAGIKHITEELLDDLSKDRYLSFILSDETYVIELMYVQEIIGIRKITKIPGVPKYIKGVMNMRGKIVPVIDGVVRFNRENAKDYNDKACVIVMETEGILLGLIVDKVGEVYTIKEDNIIPPPNKNAEENSFVKGIGRVQDGSFLILDCRNMFFESDSHCATDKKG